MFNVVYRATWILRNITNCPEIKPIWSMRFLFVRVSEVDRMVQEMMFECGGHTSKCLSYQTQFPMRETNIKERDQRTSHTKGWHQNAQRRSAQTLRASSRQTGQYHEQISKQNIIIRWHTNWSPAVIRACQIYRKAVPLCELHWQRHCWEDLQRMEQVQWIKITILRKRSINEHKHKCFESVITSTVLYGACARTMTYYDCRAKLFSAFSAQTNMVRQMMGFHWWKIAAPSDEDKMGSDINYTSVEPPVEMRLHWNSLW